MYFIAVVLLLFVFPVASILAVAFTASGAVDPMLLVGRWFVFWAVGVRLFLGGIRQVLRPQLTAEDIFGLHEPAALPIVREVGFGNLSMGTLGLLTLAVSGFIVPAAIVGGLYYGLAGLGHVVRGGKNFAGYTALVSDLLIFAVLAVFVCSRGP
jgi:hypothetical protein